MFGLLHIHFIQPFIQLLIELLNAVLECGLHLNKMQDNPIVHCYGDDHWSHATDDACARFRGEWRAPTTHPENTRIAHSLTRGYSKRFLFSECMKYKSCLHRARHTHHPAGIISLAPVCNITCDEYKHCSTLYIHDFHIDGPRACKHGGRVAPRCLLRCALAAWRGSFTVCVCALPQ